MWVDRSSVGIPYLYIATGATLADAEQAAGGDTKDADHIDAQVQAIAKATGLEGLFTPPQPPVEVQPESQATKLLDTGKSHAPPAKKP